MTVFFFFNDTATTEIYTLSLHDALPICRCRRCSVIARGQLEIDRVGEDVKRVRFLNRSLWKDPGNHAFSFSEFRHQFRDRKSTRLNSSHANISYAVFCLKKKKTDHILNS